MKIRIAALMLCCFVVLFAQPVFAEGETAEEFKVIKKAAELGEPNAQYKLGLIYEKGGTVVGAHEPTAVLWFSQAAQRGHAMAQEKMGTRYLTGKGVGVDVKKAEELLLLSGNQGYARGQYRLGQLYNRGASGVRRSYEKAVDWYTKAAKQNYAPAQYYLGGMYAMGKGVAVDRIEAYAWLALAAKQKYSKAIKSIDGLSNALSEMDITKGQGRAKKYYNEYVLKKKDE